VILNNFDINISSNNKNRWIEVDSSPITKQRTQTTVNRRSLKWHPTYINIAADPDTKTIYHKMGPLLIPLKPVQRDGSRPGIPLPVLDGPKKQTVVQLIPVQAILNQCGVE
jgi:hypothetical protein